MLLIAMEGGRITMAVRRPQSIKKIDAPRSKERSKPLGRGMSFRIYRLAKKEG